jgi:hypothetical protein
MLVDRVWRLTLVVMSLTMLIVLGIIWGAGKIPDQARVLMRVMDAQFDVLHQRLLSVGVDLFGPDGDRDFFAGFLIITNGSAILRQRSERLLASSQIHSSSCSWAFFSL